MTVRYLKQIKTVQGIYPSPMETASAARLRPAITAGFNQAPSGTVLDSALNMRHRGQLSFNGNSTNMATVKNEPNSIMSPFHTFNPVLAAAIAQHSQAPKNYTSPMKIMKRGRPQYPVTSSKTESSSIPKVDKIESENRTEQEIEPEKTKSDTSDYDSTADNIFRPYML